MRPQREIIDGTPGVIWTNDGDRNAYQLHVSGHNTCGICWQYDGRICYGPWPLGLHHGCNCRQERIKPGASASRAFVDYQAEMDKLPPEQQKKVMGASNWELYKSGTVKFEDIVTPTRIRDLHQVVDNKHLTVEDMVKAGVQPVFAQRAWDTVHTAGHNAAAAQQAELVRKITEGGISQDRLIREISGRLANRVTVGLGPVKTGTSDFAWGSGRANAPSHAAELAAVLKRFNAKKTGKRTAPKPTPVAKPQAELTPLESARQEARDKDYPVIPLDEKEAADQIVKAFIASDPIVAGDPALQKKIRQNYVNEYKPLFSDNPEFIEKLQRTINAVYSDPEYRRIIAKFGPEVVVPLKNTEKNTAEAKRRGVVTEFYDWGKLQSSEHHTVPMPGDYTIGGSGGIRATLRHEYGHHVDQKISRTERIELSSHFPDSETRKKELSGYSGKNMSEGFAEWFALITDPKYDPKNFAPWIEEARQIFLKKTK